jgi:hypothetical protein
MSYDDSIIKMYEAKGYTISFQSVIRPSLGQIKFPAFLIAFSDNYNSNWTPDNIFGRHDPIYMFGQTTREISFTIDIPSASPEEGQTNFINVKNLAKFLYPSYTSVEGSNIIKNTPLMRIRFSNLIGKGFDRKKGSILGRVQSVSISPNIESGFYDMGKSLYPKLLSLSITIDVMHEESPGAVSITGEADKKTKQKKEDGVLTTEDVDTANAKKANDDTIPLDGRSTFDRIFGGELDDNRSFNTVLDAAQTLGSTK